jgi:hypothetical protein
MNITNKTQNEKNLDALEKRVNKATLALAQTANALNDAYNCVWSLPDEQLRELLQSLLDNNKLQGVFDIHAQSAASINALLDAIDYNSVRAKEGAGREYTIVDGVVEIVPLPEPGSIEVVEEFF